MCGGGRACAWRGEVWRQMGGSYYDLDLGLDFYGGDDASAKHLRDVNMTYFEHARHSLGLAWLLAVGAAKAVLHALVPAWYPTGTTDCVRRASVALAASAK